MPFSAIIFCLVCTLSHAKHFQTLASSLMPLQSITIAQKKEIIKKRGRRIRDGQKSAHAALAEWAKAQFPIVKLLEKAIMSCNLNSRAFAGENSVSQNEFVPAVPGIRSGIRHSTHGFMTCPSFDVVPRPL